MIKVTRLNGQEFIVNGEMIEFLEANPDTVISLNTGKKLVVKENLDTIVEKIIAYKRQINGAVKIITPSEKEVE